MNIFPENSSYNLTHSTTKKQHVSRDYIFEYFDRGDGGFFLQVNRLGTLFIPSSRWSLGRYVCLFTDLYVLNKLTYLTDQ